MFTPTRTLLAALLLGASGATAATIAVPGSITGLSGLGNDQIDSWRTTSVAKTLDPDGDNVYGTAGYILYATDVDGNTGGGIVATADPLTYVSGARATFSSIPAYLTLANNGQNQIASSYGYRVIDDPTQPIGSSVSDVESGAALKGGVGLGTEASLLNINIGSNFPAAGLRIGLLFGNTDNFFATIRLTQTVGGSATASFLQTLPTPGTELGMVFFDITSANAGDVFTLSMQKNADQTGGGNTNTNVIYGGLTFDQLPEPGTAALLMVGSLLVWRRRRA